MLQSHKVIIHYQLQMSKCDVNAAGAYAAVRLKALKITWWRWFRCWLVNLWWLTMKGSAADNYIIVTREGVNIIITASFSVA